MPRGRFSAEDKLEILKVLDTGKYTIRDITSKYGVDKTTLKTWKFTLEQYGAEGLKEASACKKYSKELKLAAIEDVLSGQYSLREAARKYGISDKGVLKRWIQKYNDHREITTGSRGMSHSMTKARATTLKERIEIVLYCLSNQKDYQEAAEAYDVSYQQVYTWVRKYENDGEEALRDKRGKKKSEQELSPEEQTARDTKKLQRENERLRAENAFLKKLEQLERRRF